MQSHFSWLKIYGSRQHTFETVTFNWCYTQLLCSTIILLFILFFRCFLLLALLLLQSTSILINCTTINAYMCINSVCVCRKIELTVPLKLATLFAFVLDLYLFRWYWGCCCCKVFHSPTLSFDSLSFPHTSTRHTHSLFLSLFCFWPLYGKITYLFQALALRKFDLFLKHFIVWMCCVQLLVDSSTRIVD